MSAIGVCERCHMESGGVYFLVSHVLGARVGAAIGILYCFGQVGRVYDISRDKLLKLHKKECCLRII